MGLDQKELNKLLDWFNKSNLTSATIEYNVDGNYKITMSREQQANSNVYTQQFHAAAPHPINTQEAQESATEPTEVKNATNTEKIKSPIVGTLYRSPGPDSPPFVQAGDKIKKGQILCIIEAMKVMNELEAEFDMEIVSVSVDNGTLVEFGQEIFEVVRL